MAFIATCFVAVVVVVLLLFHLTQILGAPIVHLSFTKAHVIKDICRTTLKFINLAEMYISSIERKYQRIMATCLHIGLPT